MDKSRSRAPRNSSESEKDVDHEVFLFPFLLAPVKMTDDTIQLQIESHQNHHSAHVWKKSGK
jgi:hypothetical protein